MTKKRRKMVYEGVRRVPPVSANFYGLEDIQLEYSDNFVVQHDPDGFYLSFFQVQYPITFTREEAERIKKARLKCVGRFFVTLRNLDEIIQALAENRDKYLKKLSIEDIEIVETQGIETQDADSAQDTAEAHE